MGSCLPHSPHKEAELVGIYEKQVSIRRQICHCLVVDLFSTSRVVHNEVDCLQITLSKAGIWCTAQRNLFSCAFQVLLHTGWVPVLGQGVFFLCAQLLGWWRSTF